VEELTRKALTTFDTCVPMQKVGPSLFIYLSLPPPPRT
jgi:hypothetical protein